MTTDSYSMGRDLSALTEEQRQQHLERVCVAAGLDPAIGLLRYTYMDKNDGSGERHLVLYATKGATNAIRDNKGIDIIELTDKIMGGAYVVTAKAKNAKGRTDIATGAAALEGKRGKQLENAFALAQTRATRRVTLQMSGLDLLDESEVFDTEKAVSAVDNPPAAPPTAPAGPSDAIGADITVPAGLTLKAPTASQASAAPAPASKVEERLPNPAAGLKLATTNMAGPGIARAGQVAPIPVSVTPAPLSADPQVVSNETQPEPEAPKRRKRRTKAEMEAARAGEAPTAAQAVVDLATNTAIDAVQAQVPEAGVMAETAAKVVEAVNAAPTAAVGDLPNAEQMKMYVARLQKYREDILPNAGGMIPSNGMGVVRKVREFFSVANNNIGSDNLTKLTVAQWENTFHYMDEVVASQGAKALVAIIELNIATAPVPV